MTEKRRDVPMPEGRVRKAVDQPSGLPPSSSTFADSWARRRDIRIDAGAQLNGTFAKAVYDLVLDSAGSPTERLVKAFQNAEGRDPTPDDEQFWKAYEALVARRPASDDATPVRKRKTSDEEFLTKLQKALNGDAPTWLKSIVEKQNTRTQ